MKKGNFECPACWRRYKTKRRLVKHLMANGGEYFVYKMAQEYRDKNKV